MPSTGNPLHRIRARRRVLAAKKRQLQEWFEQELFRVEQEDEELAKQERERTGIPGYRHPLYDELTPEQAAERGIPAPVAARLRVVHEATFDDALECEKPGIVVPIRGKGK